MQKVIRLILVSLLATSSAARICVAQDPDTTLVTKPVTVMKRSLKPAEYTRADANFYPIGDLLKVDPGAVIIPQDKYTRTGDSYLFTPRIRAPKVIYGEMLSDWIEPITPPDMHPLGVPPDAMQIREPHGDVQVALPAAPASFSPVTDGMTLPNGAVVRTGADGTAAVLFGGVDSARLMPNSAAAVQQTVTALSRSAEVDLTVGGVFSKVGTQVGVKGDYEVHTPFGNAIAGGGDFVTIIASSRVDIWVAQGTVEFVNPAESKPAVSVTASGTGALKVLRDDPGVIDPGQTMAADVETLTAILNFIPLANQKIKALHDKVATGTPLTANEQAYLARIKQVPSLIKLALVEPPAPPAPMAPPPVIAPPMAATPQIVVPAPHLAVNKPAPHVVSAPLPVELRADGNVDVNGQTVSLNDLKARLLTAAQMDPNQLVLLNGREKVTRDQLKKVIAVCHQAKLKVKVAKAAPLPKAPVALVAPPPAPVAPKVEAPTINPPPVPAPAPTPPVVNTPAAAPSSPSIFSAAFPNTNTPSSAPSAAPAPAPKPMRAVVRVDGKINFQGATYEIPGFKSKLDELIKANPDQPIALRAGKTVPYANIKAALDACTQANVKNVSSNVPPPAPGSTPTPSPAMASAPVPPSAPAAAATNSTAPAVPATPTVTGSTLTPKGPASMRVAVRVDGKVNFQGSTFELPEFESKVKTIVKAAPDQVFLVRAGKTVPYEKIKAVLDVCADAQAQHVTLVTPMPAPGEVETTPPPTPVNQSVPGLRMESSMVPASDAPTSTPASPTTNSPLQPQPGP